MKTAILGDMHFGKRINDDDFIEYQISEWEKFIGYCKDTGISQIIILGDLFDNRNALPIKILDMVLNKIIDPDMKYLLLVGNHDTLFKNTNDVNTPRLLFEQYGNVEIIDSPMELYIDDTKCLFVPWINKENYDDSIVAIKGTDADYCFGHLELTGFEMASGTKCTDGLKASLFKKFKKVLTGHFHLVQKRGNIHYVGSFYQTTWTDCGDQKFIYTVGDGFEITPVPMARSIYKKIYLTEDNKISQDIVDSVADCYVIVYLNYKMKAKDEKILSKMYDCAINVDVIDMRLMLEAPDDQEVADEDFLEIFNGFMDIQDDLDDDLKAGITDLMKKTYNEALE